MAKIKRKKGNKFIKNYHQSSFWMILPCRWVLVGVDCGDYFVYFSPESFDEVREAAIVER